MSMLQPIDVSNLLVSLANENISSFATAQAGETTFSQQVISGKYFSATNSYSASFITFGQDYTHPTNMSFNMALPYPQTGHWRTHGCYYAEFDGVNEPRVMGVGFSNGGGESYTINSHNVDISSVTAPTNLFAIALCTVGTPSGLFTETANAHSIKVQLGSENVLEKNSAYIGRMERLSEGFSVKGSMENALELDISNAFHSTNEIAISPASTNLFVLQVENGATTDTCSLKINGKHVGEAILTINTVSAEQVAGTIKASGNTLLLEGSSTQIVCPKTSFDSKIGIVPNMVIVSFQISNSVTKMSFAFINSATSVSVFMVSAMVFLASAMAFFF